MKLKIEIDLDRLTAETRKGRALELHRAMASAARASVFDREMYRSLFGDSDQAIGYAIIADEAASDALCRANAGMIANDPDPECDLPDLK